MALFAAFGIGIIFLFILMVLLGGLFMWIAAKIVRVADATFVRALVASIGAAFMSVLVAFLFNLVPVIGNLFGFILGLVLSIFVIKAAFRTSFGQALLVWIFNLIATFIAVILAAMISASSLVLGGVF